MMRTNAEGPGGVERSPRIGKASEGLMTASEGLMRASELIVSGDS